MIGKYKIIEHIGRGGMADVYKALHPELDRVVAVKMLNRALVHSPEMRERFQREARAIAALRHPNIVQVFDFEIVDDVYYMVMEFIEGETLNQRLADLRGRGEHMPLSEVLRVVGAVGQALHYAHEHKMLHRDVKPSNVMIRRDGTVVLTDFGVAKILNVSSGVTATGAVAGTPAYMAPEQWTDDEPDRRSDIYSLGVVLFQLVTGELPFKDEKPGRLMFKHISDPPPRPRELNEDISVDLERVILRALTKDPEQRYQSAQELVSDLEPVVYQVESTASTGVFHPTALAGDDGLSFDDQPEAAPARHFRVPWFGAGAVVVLLALISLVLINRSGQTPDPVIPDLTGTALAARVAVLESTLSVNVTSTQKPSRTFPAPTPSVKSTVAPETPNVAAAETPSPTPTALSSTTICSITMKIEKDVNFNNTSWWNIVSVEFEKTWRLMNNGTCRWPQGTALVHLDGYDFGIVEPFEVPALPIGEQLELSVPLRTPDTPGQYDGRFQLQTSDGEPIGEPLVVVLESRLRVAPTPTLPGVFEPVQIAGYDLIEWRADTAQHIWYGKVALWATGGTGEYNWYRDTLDNALPGPVLEFEWGVCRGFFGSVWVVSGDTKDHESLFIPYPEACE